MICRHCQKVKANRPRGLCYCCYYQPGVRELYPSTSIYGQRGLGNRSTPPLAHEPTGAQPGTEAKILVMMDRAERGEQIFHPGDRRPK